MSDDMFGGMPLPVEVPSNADTDIAGDPNLIRIGAFVQALMNQQITDAWVKIEPKVDAFVGKVCYYDPTKAKRPFNSAWLPALFIWRESTLPTTPADDYLVDTSDLHMLWVASKNIQLREAQHDPIFNAFSKIIADAFWIGRDPAWIDPNDTDPTAAERGSVLAELCNLYQMITMSRIARQDVSIEVDGGDPKLYFGFKAQAELAEVRVIDPSTRPGVAPTSVQVDITIDGLNVDESIDGA